MPKPKPRGVQGSMPMQRTDRSEIHIPVLLAPLAIQLQHSAATACVTPEVVDMVASSATLAQPPPLSWGDMAASWMSTQPELPLN